MTNSMVAKAEAWLDKFEDFFHGEGDAWVVGSEPEFNEAGEIVGERFSGELVMRGVDYGDEENDTARLDISADEDFVRGICWLYNKGPEMVLELLNEVERMNALLKQIDQMVTDAERQHEDARHLVDKILELRR